MEDFVPGKVSIPLKTSVVEVKEIGVRFHMRQLTPQEAGIDFLGSGKSEKRSMGRMLSASLINAEGKPLFESVEKGEEEVAKWPVALLEKLTTALTELNSGLGEDVESRAKK